jgi:enediyne core biosynthesis thioesterase
MNLNMPTAKMGVAKTVTQRGFRYRHIVTFQETNVIGNVYFTHHIAWQGRCREIFLKQHAPDILDEIARDLRLVTRQVSCEYFEELRAFDEIEVEMRLAYIRQNRIGLDFNLELCCKEKMCVARGFQEIGCARTTPGGLVATPPPALLIRALTSFHYSSSETVERNLSTARATCAARADTA